MRAETIEDCLAWSDSGLETAAGCCALALGLLPRMFVPAEGLFSFRLNGFRGGEQPLGTSLRYTGIVLLGLGRLPTDQARDILHGRTPRSVCEALVQRAAESDELGAVALARWAARELGVNGDERLARHLDRILEARPVHRTVEFSWALQSCLAGDHALPDLPRARALAERLLAAFRVGRGVFPSSIGPAQEWRRHVLCFADFVYPIQALSTFYQRTHDQRAADVVKRATQQMCALQGPQGQWWWHFDARTGSVLERYPVYAVHQHAMAPMALFAAKTAGVPSALVTRHIDLSLAWLRDPPELSGRTLVDPTRGVIWRKVARQEPRRAVRAAQALLARMNDGWRLPLVDRVCPARKIDFECRPYELGWLLYTWFQRLPVQLGVRGTA